MESFVSGYITESFVKGNVVLKNNLANEKLYF